jgi:hypothetical protein
VYSIVANLIALGPEGIVELIREKLDPATILNQIIKAAVDYMVKAVIKAVAARIILLFNPVGAILEALEAIYKVLKWIFVNAARIFRLIEGIVNGIADIIAGNIGGMANTVEKALAQLIPPVIDFLADYLGFGDLPDKVKDTILGLQEWVEGVLDQVIGWLVEKGKALLKAIGLGGDDKDKKKAAEGQIGKKVSWTAAGESHSLWIAKQAGGVSVRMASEEKPVAQELDEYDEKAKSLEGDKRAKTAGLISQARQILGGLDQNAGEMAEEVKNPDAKPEQTQAEEAKVETGEDQLAAVLAQIREALGLADPEQIKKDVAAEIQKLPRQMETEEDLTQALRGIFSRHEPRGLKKLNIQRVGEGYDILAEASAARFSDHLIGLTKDGAGGCSIMIQIDGNVLMDGDDGIARVIWNAGSGGPHAEARLYANLSAIQAKLTRETRLIEIWIRYSPCQDRCAFVLNRIEDAIHQTHQLVQFRWYFEDLWVAPGHTREAAQDVVDAYRGRGIFIMRRLEAIEKETFEASGAK